MDFAIVLLAGLIFVANPDTLPVHPGAKAIFSGATPDSLVCDEEKIESTLEVPAPTRTSNFRLRGSFNCRRPIFTHEERNSFVETVVRAEIPKAKRIAAAMQLKYQNSKTPLAPLFVNVRGLNEPEIESLVAAIYRIELSSTLGLGQIAVIESEKAPRLQIVLQRVSSPDLISKVQLGLLGPSGEFKWQDL